MQWKSQIKKGLEIIFSKRPIQTKVSVAQLSPGELLTNRRALVTGGTSGIGYAIAQAFLKAGAEEVIITGRNQSRIDSAVCKLSEYGNVNGYVLDNAQVGSFEEAFQKMTVDHKIIDILVNNAGVLGAVLPNAKEEEFDLVLNTNTSVS